VQKDESETEKARDSQKDQGPEVVDLCAHETGPLKPSEHFNQRRIAGGGRRLTKDELECHDRQKKLKSAEVSGKAAA